MGESYFYERAESVTPSDTTTLFKDGGLPHARALLIGTAGALAVVTAGGDTLTIASVPVGELRLAVTQVKATGTTAAQITALY